MDSCKSAKLVDSFDNSFYSEKNLYKKDRNLSDSLGDNLVYELKQLDSTLDDLFLTTNQQLNTHYSIHKVINYPVPSILAVCLVLNLYTNNIGLL